MPDEPTLPGFMMTEDPDELPTAIVEIRDYTAGQQLDGQVISSDLLPIEPEIIPPRTFQTSRTGSGGAVRYEARIQILEAYQYPGNLKGAPDWVDRNWAAYASDYDPLRGIEPGPALRVPTRSGENVLCRPGDYVVTQSVTLMHGIEPDIVVEVWSRESFEKNFLPTSTPERTPAAVPSVPAA